MKKDYSYITIGYKFPISNIKCLSKEYEKRDDPTPSKPKGTLRHYVKCECPFCKNEFEGRLDRLEFNPEKQKGPRTLCCKSCSLIHKRPFEDPWRASEENHAEKKGININRTENLENKIFENMLVLAPELGKTDKYGMTWWLCRCLLCGNEELVRTDALRGTSSKDGYKKCSCSKCLKCISSGEQLIEKWFKENNIVNYTHHVKFSDLHGVGGRLLDFDFGIKNKDNNYKILIEFQGYQHYNPVELFGGQEQFKKQQEHDNRKREYCKEHNIQLIEIPYNYKNIEDYLSQLKS